MQAAASRLPAAVDRAWEAVGGGPADLVFPELFLGRWTATSTLVSLEMPLGADQLPPALVRLHLWMRGRWDAEDAMECSQQQ